MTLRIDSLEVFAAPAGAGGGVRAAIMPMMMKITPCTPGTGRTRAS